MERADIGLKLEPGVLNAIHLRLVVARYAEEREKHIEVWCHMYLVDTDRTIDIFHVIDGRLVRTAIYSNVIAVEECDD